MDNGFIFKKDAILLYSNGHNGYVFRLTYVPTTSLTYASISIN